jgi:DNA-binding XRE family transcriptional regulator
MLPTVHDDADDDAGEGRSEQRRALGRLLREVREARGWRQHDLAAAGGWTVRTIAEFERDGPPDSAVDRLDDALGGVLRKAAAVTALALPPPQARSAEPVIEPFAAVSPMFVEPGASPPAATRPAAAPTRGSQRLAEFLRARMRDAGLESSHELGDALHVAQGTALRLLKAQSVATEETLSKIARWSHVPITEIRVLAERHRGDVAPFRVPREFDQLTPPQRAVILQVGRCFLEADGKRVTR